VRLRRCRGTRGGKFCDAALRRPPVGRDAGAL